MKLVSEAIWRAYSKPLEGATVQTWKRLRVPEAAAAELLLDLFKEIHRAATGRYPEKMPGEMSWLRGIHIDSSHQRIRAPKEST
jgi:hypothetical protein